MISLNIDVYCENCDEFEPDVNKMRISADYKEFHDTVITCIHSNRCKSIANCIKEESEKKE